MRGHKANAAGAYVSLDFTGPHEPGVTGSTYGMVGVEMEHDWGYVGLLPDISRQW